MSDTTASLRRTIGSATDLQSVVRTMKALAASRIAQYEQSVLALNDYRRSLDLGLGACLRAAAEAARSASVTNEAGGVIGDAGDAVQPIAIVFGSDQGLVGQFNEAIADHAIRTMQALPVDAGFWAIGERVHAQLTAAGRQVLGLFRVPSSVEGIAPLVAQIQVETEVHGKQAGRTQVHAFHNAPRPGAVFAPTGQRLLPLDAAWQRELAGQRWPTARRPDVLCGVATTLPAFVREHLFISLFRACAESLASENASRLAAMERADRNIDERLQDLNRSFHRLRQSSIDNELFDVTAGFSVQS